MGLMDHTLRATTLEKLAHVCQDTCIRLFIGSLFVKAENQNRFIKKCEEMMADAFNRQQMNLL